MCWSLEVSLAAAVYGFGMSYYFYRRGFSPRDPWYALFLSAFTCTQLLDAWFWARADADGRVDCDASNRFFSKWVVTPVLFSQVWALTVFPSTQCAWLRWPYRALTVAVVLGTGLVAGCTYSMHLTHGLVPSMTLVYWGFIPPWWLFLCGVALWSIAALLFITPTLYAVLILAVGGVNLLLLLVIDGLVFLVSKLCLYCLLLSLLWLVEPCWAPRHPSPHSSSRADVSTRDAAKPPPEVVVVSLTC